tara:strand:+ start:50861 stop:51109 length:249 start_codon:yes stop_codon:yes gene_type:complete
MPCYSPGVYNQIQKHNQHLVHKYRHNRTRAYIGTSVHPLEQQGWFRLHRGNIHSLYIFGIDHTETQPHMGHHSHQDILSYQR